MYLRVARLMYLCFTNARHDRHLLQTTESRRRVQQLRRHLLLQDQGRHSVHLLELQKRGAGGRAYGAERQWRLEKV